MTRQTQTARPYLADAVNQTRRRRNIAWLGCIFLGFFCLFSAVQNVGYFDATDSLNRFRAAVALVQTGSPNWVDNRTGEVQVCLNSPGPAIAAAPFQLAAYLGCKTGILHGQMEQILIRSTLVGSIFFSSLELCALAALCLALGGSRKKALAVCMVAGLTTLILPYSKSAQAENLVGLGILLIVILLHRYEQHRHSTLIAASGLIYGFLLTCKNELAAAAPVLFGSLLLTTGGALPQRIRSSLKPAFILGVSLLPGIAFMLWFNYARFGIVLQTGHLGDSHDASLLKPFSYPFFQGLYLQTLSPGKGILWYCPVLLCTLPLLWRFLRHQPRIMLLPYAWWAVMTCVYAKWYSPAGDTALGSRFQVSYLPFAVLPLLSAFRTAGAQRTLTLAWCCVCVSVSFLLQVLFTIVSFNIDFHRQLASVETIAAKLALLNKMYFDPGHSLLTGFFRTFREGLLDLNYIRWQPLEGALTVYPQFWLFMTAAALALALAVTLAKPPHSSSPGRSVRLWPYVVWSPAAILLACFVARVGYPGHRGMALKISNAAGAIHRTIIQDISIKNMDAGRALYTVPVPATMRWKGKIYYAEPGISTFRLESNRPLTLTHDGMTTATESGTSYRTFLVTAPGWHKLAIECGETQMTDHFFVRCRVPGEEKFVRLKDLPLRH